MEQQQYQFREHDLMEIFKSVFGYTAPPFLFSLQNKVENALFRKSKTSEEYEFNTTGERREYNMHGVPFYANNANGNEMFLPIWLIRPDGSRLLLQNTVSSMVGTTIIKEETMVNRKGSFKEEIALSDWDMNVKGLIVSTDMDYPDEMVYELVQLREMGTALGIENARTSLLIEDDEKVVIKRLRFTEIKGMKHIQAFEMDLVSDNTFSLIIE
ncbi:DUF6046 domain-containing protein [Dysgonomonas sp.]